MYQVHIFLTVQRKSIIKSKKIFSQKNIKSLRSDIRTGTSWYAGISMSRENEKHKMQPPERKKALPFDTAMWALSFSLPS
jgi:hypothetical protein